jgi:hypothetical protein
VLDMIGKYLVLKQILFKKTNSYQDPRKTEVNQQELHLYIKRLKQEFQGTELYGEKRQTFEGDSRDSCNAFFHPY